MMAMIFLNEGQVIDKFLNHSERFMVSLLLFSHFLHVQVSATSYTLIGVMSKLMTIMMNVLLIEFSGWKSVGCLLVSLTGGLWWSLESAKNKETEKNNEVKEEDNEGKCENIV